MIGFDYLHDATPEVIARLTRFRLPQRYVPTAVAFACILTTAVGATILQDVRLAQAASAQTQEYSALLDSRQALARAKLETRDVNGLLALDATVAAVRGSGFRRAWLIAKLGAQIPRGAWLESIAPDSGRVTLSGRALNFQVVAETLGRLDRASFGHVALSGASRLVAAGQTPEVAFAIAVDSRTP